MSRDVTTPERRGVIVQIRIPINIPAAVAVQLRRLYERQTLNLWLQRESHAVNGGHYYQRF